MVIQLVTQKTIPRWSQVRKGNPMTSMEIFWINDSNDAEDHAPEYTHRDREKGVLLIAFFNEGIICDTSDSSPLPSMYSRLTDYAKYMIDCGDYGMLGFSLRHNFIQ